MQERQADNAAILTNSTEAVAQLVAAFLHDSDSREEASGRRHL